MNIFEISESFCIAPCSPAALGNNGSLVLI